MVVYNRRCNPEGGHPDWVDTAHTLLLDVSGDLWKGGTDAEKQIATMIANALAPYRKANAHPWPLHECFSLKRCTQCEEPLPLHHPFPFVLEHFFPSSS